MFTGDTGDGAMPVKSSAEKTDHFAVCLMSSSIRYGIQSGNRRKRQSAMYRGTDTLNNSPLIRASLLATKESGLPEPLFVLRPIHNRQPRARSIRSLMRLEDTTNHLVTKAS